MSTVSTDPPTTTLPKPLDESTQQMLVELLIYFTDIRQFYLNGAGKQINDDLMRTCIEHGLHYWNFKNLFELASNIERAINDISEILMRTSPSESFDERWKRISKQVKESTNGT